ncbi:MAG: tetratricopeptide repeat protein, partial [Cyclobacteriaceae bacterium]
MKKRSYPQMNTTNYYQLFFKKLICNTILVFICVQLFAQNQQEIQIANEYLSKGEKPKALAAFQTLAKDFQNIPVIHNNYLNLMLDMSQFKQAEDYVEKIIKKDDRITYRLDLGVVYVRAGELAKADKYLKSIIKIQIEDVYKAKIIADYLASKNLVDYAVYSLQQARNVTN